MDIVTVPVNAYGIDFLSAYPDPELLVQRGVHFVAPYLKNWRTNRIAEYIDAGIAVVPIWEVAETSASGGATIGAQHATRAVHQCRDRGIPPGTPIIFTNDTNAWGPSFRDYFVAAEHGARSNGYGMAGYGSRLMFDDTIGAGVEWDIIWAIAATSFGGGRHPLSHVWQGLHHSIRKGNKQGMWAGKDLDVTDMGSIDTNVARRPFVAWGTGAATGHGRQSGHGGHETDRTVVVVQPTPPPAPPPPPEEPDMIITIVESTRGADGLPQTYDAQFIAEATASGAICRVIWVDGANARAIAALAAHRAGGATVKHLDVADFATLWTSAVPAGDTRHDWTVDDFAGIG